jgi:uncharacterized Zn-finger protein
MRQPPCRAISPANRIAFKEHDMHATDNNVNAVELDGKDLPAYCPNPAMPIWSSHPRVFLDVAHTGHATCPYCSTEYRLKPGAVVKAH